jgi:hypothetical protein
VLTIREEEVGGSEIYGMAMFQPDTSSVENPVLPVSQATVTGQDADNGAQPAVSQAQGVTCISPRCCIPKKAIRSFLQVEGRGESDTRATEMKMVQSQRNSVNMKATSDRPTQAGQDQIQEKIQFRAYFVTTVEVSMT